MLVASRQKTVREYGANRTLHIRLHDKYWDVLFAMTQMSGQSPEDHCVEAIKCDIKTSLDDPESFGKMLCDGWRETLKDK